MKKIIFLAVLFSIGLTGCKPCSDLEARICADLGTKCEKWKVLGKPGLPSADQDQYRSGRRKLVAVLLESAGLVEANAQVCQSMASDYDSLIDRLKRSVQ
ncbi:hypothetical protein EHQ05_13990 [Leptospira yasudae]|uniref:Lipoprotein n=1 Tax=Leptospira yasudae TaxID=2202201 RepID=A0ABX9M664_9LEPT|nr:hypothetical protein [Leptospira yasudae]RHX80880.1 hypothetical protein DLM77_08390 [Leptospira yasudae]TGK24056.1 hypothetical protein EHQ05_13990 [Leptospira yasudae]TGM00665.1 hypothetical protein EHQ86_18890 [Leptospira yasudae]